MKKVTKNLLLPLALTTVLGSLSACGGFRNSYAYDIDFNADVRGTTIQFWTGFGSDLNDTLEEIIDEFEKITGVNVKYESKGSYDGCLKAVGLAATSGKYPHLVVGYPDHWASYVKSDIIVRLDYYFENDVHNEFEPEGESFKMSDFYSDYMRENQSVEFDKEGNPYTLGVPFNKSTEVMTYNKTFFDWIFTQDSLKNDIYIPTTYDEVESVGKAILKFFKDNSLYGNVLYKDGTTTKGSQTDRDVIIDLTDVLEPTSTQNPKAFKPFAYDSKSNFFITTVRQSGGTYTYYDKEAKHGYLAFDSQETRTGLNRLVELYDEQVIGIPSDFGEEKYNSKPFQANRCVMTVGSSAGVANAAAAGNKFKIAAAPTPFHSADKKFVISQGANLALLDKGSREERLASWQLLKFLSKYANGYFCAQTGYFPTCAYAELPGEDGKSGSWVGAGEDFTDYATWLEESKTSASTAVGIRAAAAEVNVSKYINEAEGWVKFVDQPFAGSATIREEVAAIIPWIFTHEKTVDQAIKDMYAKLREYTK